MEKRKITKYLGIHGLFKSVSDSFINLFVPLIIYNQIGYRMAILYLIMLTLSTTLALLIFSKLIKKQPIIAICIHIFLAISAYIIIALCEINILILFIVAILTGVSQALYHSTTPSIISANKSEDGFVSFKIWQCLGKIIMVIFNGYILNLGESFSILLTCIISFILYTISVIPFFIIIKHINLNKDMTVSKKEVWHATKKHNVFSLFFGLQDLIIGLIIPLYLAINNLSIDKIAIIVALINFIKIIITILANKMYKNEHSFVSILIGAIIFAISCIFLLITSNKIIVYIMSVLGGMVFPLFYIPTLNDFQTKIKGMDTEGMITREICVHAFRPLVLLPFLFINNLTWLIGFGIFISIGIIISGYFIFKKEK